MLNPLLAEGDAVAIFERMDAFKIKVSDPGPG
jgi:hypothetical protein